MTKAAASAGFFAAVSVALASVVPCDAAPLNLICLGRGVTTEQTMTMSQGMDSYGNYASGQAFSERKVAFEDQVGIQLDPGAESKIRLPRAMLPQFHRGKDGWFAIDKFKAGETEFSGDVQVSLMTGRVKLLLDRITGHINLTGGLGTYSGQCEPFDPTTVQRKF